MKNIGLILLLFLTLVAGMYSYSTYFKSEKVPNKASWYTTEKSFDIISGSGKLIILNDAGNKGIRIVSPDYQELNRDYWVTIYDPKSVTETQKKILSNIPEYTSVKLLQNTLDPETIWVITYRQLNDCHDKDCNFNISEFDISTGTLNYKTVIQFNLVGSSEVSLHSLIPLLHDPTHNRLWFAYNTTDPKYQYNYFDSYKQNYVAEKKNAYITSVIAYDLNSNKTALNKSLVRGVNFNNRLHNYDVDQDGNLYTDTSCIFQDCPPENNSIITAEPQIYKISPNERVYKVVQEPVFTFGMDPSLRQFSIDQKNASMFLVTKAWSASPGSAVLHFDTKRKISTQIGVPPIDFEEDVRGMLSIENKLLIGTFHGLGIYDKASDSWKTVTSSDGIKDDNVEVIAPFAGGICLRHETQGSSCYYGSMSQL